MGIGIRLKEVLKDQDLTIKEVSKRCDIPYRTLQNYLLGEREPNAKALATIGTQLGISLDWLLTGEGNMYPRFEGATVNIIQETTPAYGLSPREQAVLDLFKNLNPEQQQEVLRDAEEKQRIAEMEKNLKELQAQMEHLKKMG